MDGSKAIALVVFLDGFAQQFVRRRNPRQPAVAGESVKPGVERSGTQELWTERPQPAVAGDSPEVTPHRRQLSRAGIIFGLLTWGSAALHPRLYAFARYRGLGLGIHRRRDL